MLVEASNAALCVTLFVSQFSSNVEQLGSLLNVQTEFSFWLLEKRLILLITLCHSVLTCYLLVLSTDGSVSSFLRSI